MTEKKKLDENQIWTTVMTVLPVVILMNAGNELTDDNGMRVLYAGAFGGIGGLIGFVANYLTKDKNRFVKILTSILIVLSCGLTLFFLSSKPTDAEILDKEWTTQKIGMIEFDSPTKLELQTSEIPESVKWFYSEMNLYSDEGADRITSFMESKILIDTLTIENAYSGALEGMLSKLDVNMDNVELEVFGADEEEVSSMFSFELNGKKVNGYGFMYMNKDRLESIWLMPLKRGFSKDYIEEFEAGIIPDYE
ncbi:MAG: hypothetical protein H6571_16610 [Lewinellaceae bacterium]|nr:hypothetical protein [Lewinellaceae bacterium]